MVKHSQSWRAPRAGAAVWVIVAGLHVACVSQPQSGSGGPGTAGNATSCPAGATLCTGICFPNAADDDNRCGVGLCAVACGGGQHCTDGVCQSSKIEHVVLIVQENHTFDSYFGAYCQLDAGTNPSCTMGPQCCERPIVDTGSNTFLEPGGAAAIALDDISNFAEDRNHDQACEKFQIDGGLMDHFVTGDANPTTNCYVKDGPDCSSPNNWAMAVGTNPTDAVHYYWSLAGQNALADRYFQPVAGGTASNNMYLAGAAFRFVDNAKMPNVVVGTRGGTGLCVDPIGCIDTTPVQPPYSAGTIGGLLLDAGKTFGVYADGYADAYQAATTGGCPSSPPECPYGEISHPVAHYGCLYDPSDIPFLFYERFADTLSLDGQTSVVSPYVHDYAALQSDVLGGTLPSFSYVKARLFHNEHPNMSTITDGEAFVNETINTVLGSPTYANNTLVLVTWDEGGGFFDHVAPPAPPPVNVDADAAGQPVPYGTRVPLLAIGPFARKGAVSHVVMEHSSVVRFLEYNFVGPVGQLKARDGWVNNIGSMLEPTLTGVRVPE